LTLQEKDNLGLESEFEALTDEDPMPFGTHKGTPMGQLKPSYLDWLADWEGIDSWPRVKRYIEDNWDAIQMDLWEDDEYGPDDSWRDGAPW
jgi:hypothetical protein